MAPSAVAPVERRVAVAGLGPWTRVCVLVLALSTLGAVGHVWVRLKGLEVAYDLGRERHTNEELREQRRRFQIEIEMLKDPGRVVLMAKDKLGMRPPEPGEIRIVGGARPAGPGAAAGAREAR